MSEIIHFDQQLLLALNGSDSIYWDGFWYCVTKVAPWIFFYASMLYVLLRSYDYRQVFLILLMVGLAILLADQGASGVCKPYFKRFRPSHEPLLAGQVALVKGKMGGLYGFMSSHAANGFAICTFLSLVFRYRWTTFVLVQYACFTSFSRIYLGLHYPGDILCGGIWGVVSGLIAYGCFKYLNQRFFKVRKFYSDAYTPSGIVKEDASIPVFAFFLTMCAICIYACIWASC